MFKSAATLANFRLPSTQRNSLNCPYARRWQLSLPKTSSRYFPLLPQRECLALHGRYVLSRDYASPPPIPPAWEARQKLYRARNRSLFMYTSSVIILALGITYASVPLYRLFCSATGFGGTPMTGKGKFASERLVPVTGTRRIKVHFNSDTSDNLPWKFTPQQKYIYVLPGETALAFYKVQNKSDQDIIGIATYNVTPDKIAPYFAKVECFCFEEQKLLAGEEVDLPLFFFIDRDFVEDPSMNDLDDIVLSYTFFRARRNTHGHLEPDAPEDVVDKSMGWSEYTKVKDHNNSMSA